VAVFFEGIKNGNNKDMTNTELIVSAITWKRGQVFDGLVCCLCGGHRSIDGFTESKKVLSGHFTDRNLMKVRTSDLICDFCKLALSDGLLESTNGNCCALRNVSFLVEGMDLRFKVIAKDEKIKYLFQYHFQSPFILAFTEKHKKHISFKSVISSDPDRFYVCCEDGNVFFERKKWLAVYQIAQDFLDKGVFKSELESCVIPPWKFER
jgi:hypothetical protein